MDLAFVALLSSLFPNYLLSLLAKVYLFHDFSRVRVLLILIVFGIFIAEVPVLLYSITSCISYITELRVTGLCAYLILNFR